MIISAHGDGTRRQLSNVVIDLLDLEDLIGSLPFAEVILPEDDLHLLLTAMLLFCSGDEGEESSSPPFVTEVVRDFLLASLALHCSSDSRPNKQAQVGV